MPITRLLYLAIFISLPCLADVSVIVNLSNHNKIDIKEVRQIFLSKKRSFPDGTAVTTYDLKDAQAEKNLFYEKVLKKSTASLMAYWARMLFSGRGVTPIEVNSSEEMLAQVSKNKTALGYINSQDVNSTVKVLFTVQ